MRVSKIIKDWLLKKYYHPRGFVPDGLVEIQKYFRNNAAIKFNHYKEDGLIVAISENFRYGSIMTFANTEDELDEKIKDAILTSFKIPSSYAKQVGIHQEGKNKHRAYAAA